MKRTLGTIRSYEVSLENGDWATTINAGTAGAAKYRFLLNARDAWPDLSFKHLKCRSLGIAKPHIKPGVVETEQFNSKNPIGTPVRYWTGLREGPGRSAHTRSLAQIMCDHAVVWVTGEASCISLTHVEPTGDAA